jgi:N-acetylglucosaminyldiphosphoundecaprenol N-acetyl-beta-D-mannosaminyltransferase
MIFKKLIKSEDDVIKLVSDYSESNGNLLLTYLNQHCYNLYNSSSEYRNLLDHNFIVFADGLGVYSALKFLGYKNLNLFNATDAYIKIFQKFSANRKKIFIIGGRFSGDFIKMKAAEHNLEISGHENGYFQPENFDQVINAVNKSQAEIVIIGMGVPKQEILASKMDKKVHNKIILCVGGCLEFYFGTKKRAPNHIRKAGLEWLYRLKTEPIRLWKRYIFGIPLFYYHVIKLKLMTAGN